MGIDDGLHLPRLNGKPILVIFCEPLPSFEGMVSFTTSSYSCTSPKYSGTSEWPRWSSSWYINKLCRMIMIIIDSNIVKRDLGALVSNFLFINSIIFILFNHFLNLWVICSPPFQPSKQHKPQEWSSRCTCTEKLRVLLSTPRCCKWQAYFINAKGWNKWSTNTYSGVRAFFAVGVSENEIIFNRHISIGQLHKIHIISIGKLS